jgi:hypothetical protein
MGRNLKDFYLNTADPTYSTSGRDFHRPDVKGQDGSGVIVSRHKKRVVATPDNGNMEASRKVSRNRDVKKVGNRLAEVAVGNKSKLRKDV